MKVIYVAGPYRAPNVRGIVENIRRAEAVALALWRKGWAVICPHMNTRLFDGAAPDHVWLEGDLAILSRCDALCMVEGWKWSEGAKAERCRAMTLGLPIFDNIDEVPNEAR